MKDENYKKLTERYLSQKASEEELVLFFKLLSEGKLDQIMKNHMKLDLPDPLVRKKSPRFLSPFWMSMAAVLLAGLTLFWLLVIKDKSIGKTEEFLTKNVQIIPGTEKARLILSDGSVVDLDGESKRIDMGGAVAFTDGAGELTFDLSKVASPPTDQVPLTQYNRIETPAGGTYRIILPDNSVVWLNSQSTIRFPTIFENYQRKVYVEGEVCFEVAKDSLRPFLVHTNTQVVKVLGTRFNINAYPDELSVKTTVIEGRVVVQKDDKKMEITRGQQAIVNESGGGIVMETVDVENIIAWKNGFFRFDEADIKTIMRQIARWYNVEVEYQGKVSTDTFVGKIPRSENIETVLNILRKGKLNITIKGRKLTILQ